MSDISTARNLNGKGRPRAPGTADAPGPIRVVALDGDDTLWHNESLFSLTQQKFRALLCGYVAEEVIARRLLATETANLRLFGYGIKGFTLSMIETAIEVSGGRVSAAEISTIINHGKAMLDHPVQLLDGVEETIAGLLSRYRLMVITKGDLFDQESKIARSGLAESFWKIEIVTEKDAGTYRRILDRHEVRPDEFVMVGNSVRSDVLPVLEIGARAIHIPYHVTWAHEQAELDEAHVRRACRVRSIQEVPAALTSLTQPRPAETGGRAAPRIGRTRAPGPPAESGHVLPPGPDSR